MTKRDWFLLGLLAVAVVVIYNLTRSTSVLTTQTDGDVLDEVGGYATTPGGGPGQDTYGAGPNTVSASIVAAGINA